MLLRILTLILVMLFVPDLYIFLMYIRRWTKSIAWRMLWWLPTLALLFAAFVIMHSNDMKPEHQPWVGMFMISFMSVCVPKTLFWLFDGLGHLLSLPFYKKEKQCDNWCVRLMRIVGMTLSLFAFIILSVGYFWGRHNFVVHQQTFFFDDLPAKFDGYRIAHFSDMHTGTFRDGNEGDVRKIVDLINAQKCDAVLFTGDLVNHQSSELDGFRRDFSLLKAIDGVYSVMGNHDYSMYLKYPTEQERSADVKELQRRQETYGWTLLLNDHRVIHRGTDSLVIMGVENDGRPPFPAYGNVPKAMKGLNDSCFKILLSHDPTHWRRRILKKTNIQLTLSGHTHAGQFKVLGWSPVAHIYDEWSGPYAEGNQILNVSDGIGAVMFPFRFGAWPEINVITLRRNKK